MENIMESCSRLQFPKVCTESQGGSSNINPAQQRCGVKRCSRNNKLSVYLSSSFSQDLDFSLLFRLIKVRKSEICRWKNHKSPRIWTLRSGAGFILNFIALFFCWYRWQDIFYFNERYGTFISLWEGIKSISSSTTNQHDYTSAHHRRGTAPPSSPSQS